MDRQSTSPGAGSGRLLAVRLDGFAAEVADYLDASTPEPVGGVDVIFVPGTRLPDPARIAADLLARRVGRLAVLTGGINRATGQCEAQEHHRLMLELGVSAERLIVEDRSTNTLENVTMAWPLVRERCPEVTTVLAVAKWMHSRRVLMTLKRNWPPGIRYYARTYAPDGVDRENWLDSSAASTVWHNWESIPRYVSAGHLSEVTLDGGAYV